MSMTIMCPGGHRLQVRDDLAGKKIRCPKCGAIVAAPPREPAAVSTMDGVLPSATRRRPSADPTPGVPRVAGDPVTASPWKLPALVGGGVVLVAIAVVAAMILGGRRGSIPSSPEDVSSAAATGPDTGNSVTAATSAPGSATAVAAPSGAPTSGAVRHFPSLPDAPTSLPTWIGPDGPFDVGQFLAAPPVEQNAAPLYFDALFEFSDELAPCFPEAEARRRAPAARDRQTRFDSIYQTYEQAPAAVPLDKIDAILAEFDAGLQKLEAAQQRQRCVFEIGLSLDATLLHAQTMRTATRVLAWRAVRDAQTGQHERAIERVATALRMCRDVTPRGPTVCQLVSMAMEAHTYGSAGARILNSPGLRVEHCDRLMHVVREHDTQQLDRLVEGIKGEYVLQRQVLADFQQRTGMFSPARLAELEKQPPAADSVMAVLLRIARDPQLANQPAQNLPAEIQQLNQFYQAALDVAARPSHEQVQALQGTAQGVNASLVKLLLPDFTQVAEADRRTKTRRSGMQCLIALRRWQLEHIEPPPDLDTLFKATKLFVEPIVIEHALRPSREEQPCPFGKPA